MRRLDHHASLAIWGGNNEIEVAFGWFPDSRDPDKARLYAADYNQVPATLRLRSPWGRSRRIWPSVLARSAFPA